jgi:hypothetical protein
MPHQPEPGVDRAAADDPAATGRRPPRPSALRLLGLALASIIVTALLFRAAVEAVRIFLAP